MSEQRRIIIIKFEAKKTITSLRYLSVSVNLGTFAANFADAVDRLLICHKLPRGQNSTKAYHITLHCIFHEGHVSRALFFLSCGIVSLIISMTGFTGRGQKVHIHRIVLPVADK